MNSLLPYSGYFSGGKIFVDMEILRVRGKNFVVLCKRALMSVSCPDPASFNGGIGSGTWSLLTKSSVPRLCNDQIQECMESNYCTCAYIIYIHVHALCMRWFACIMCGYI